MGGWVTCMSYAASARVGDFGTLYAADAAAAIVKINPCIVDGPNVWKETSQIQWKVTGTVKDAKLSMPLAFRYMLCCTDISLTLYFINTCSPVLPAASSAFPLLYKKPCDDTTRALVRQIPVFCWLHCLVCCMQKALPC